jgi:prepilin peptidase CpaA
LLLSSDALVPLAAVAGSIAGAVIDLRTRRVPNVLTFGMAATGLAVAAAGLGPIDLAAAFTGLLVGACLMLPGHLFGATGGGDVKLLAAAGAFLGPSLTLMAFFATAVAGGLLALGVAVSRGRLAVTVRTTGSLVSGRAKAADIEHPASDNAFAYAPAIAIGVALAVLGA